MKNVLVYVNFVCWLPLYSAVIHSIENSLLSRIYSLYLLLLRFWMIDCSVLQGVLNIHWSGALIYSAVCLLHGWCHVRLLPSRRMFGVHHATMHQFTVSLEATYIISFWYWKFYSCIRSVMSFFLVFFLLFFSFTPFSCSLSEIRLVRILLLKFIMTKNKTIPNNRNKPTVKTTILDFTCVSGFGVDLFCMFERS